MLKIETAEKYCKEYKRKYFGNYRVFEHPSLASAVIVFENDKLKGIIAKRYIKSANRWRYVETKQAVMYEFEY